MPGERWTTIPKVDQDHGELGPVEPEGLLQRLRHQVGRAPGVVVPQPHVEKVVEEGVYLPLVEEEGDQDGVARPLDGHFVKGA